MGIGRLKAELHDRLWNAQQKWFALREDAKVTKHELKIAGIREAGDPNRLLRSIIFTGRTRMTYEQILKGFVEFVHARFGVERLDGIDGRHARAFLDDGIARGLAAKTLHTQRSAIAKLFALVGKTESGAALSRKYGERIRALVAESKLQGPRRETPAAEVVSRAIEILRKWDEEHAARTGRPRAYHLAARLQMETAGRSVSVTERMTKECLKEVNQVELTGKGGRNVLATITSDLHAALLAHLEAAGGPLADLRGYQAAWRRAVQAAGGPVAGTHGLRRRSIQEFYRAEYARLLARGMPPDQARAEARAAAVERLGHSRDRSDQAECYLGATDC